MTHLGLSGHQKTSSHSVTLPAKDRNVKYLVSQGCSFHRLLQNNANNVKRLWSSMKITLMMWWQTALLLPLLSHFCHPPVLLCLYSGGWGPILVIPSGRAAWLTDGFTVLTQVRGPVIIADCPTLAPREWQAPAEPLTPGCSQKFLLRHRRQPRSPPPLSRLKLYYYLAEIPFVFLHRCQTFITFSKQNCNLIVCTPRPSLILLTLLR